MGGRNESGGGNGSRAGSTDPDAARRCLVDGRAREMSVIADDAGGGGEFFSSSSKV